MPKVSVVIPFYNVSAYIDKCLESMFNQSLADIEIICINDNSTDNTKDVVVKWMKKDFRIKLIENSENKGPGRSRNSGVLASSSPYIAFIDSDDYVSITYLEELYSTAIKYNADMVFTDNIYTVRERVRPYYHNRVSKWKKMYGKDYFEGISHFHVDRNDLENTREYPLVMAANKMWKKNFLNGRGSFIQNDAGATIVVKDNDINFLGMEVAEDVDFFYRALAYNPIIAFNHKAEYYYVQRNISLTNAVKNNDKIPLSILEVFENIFNCYKEKNINKLVCSTYWNFRSFMSTFDNYKGSKKEELYKLSHSLFKKLDASIDSKKYPFVASQLYVFKTYENYSDYIKLIQDKKDRVYKIAWYIPTLALREHYRNSRLDKIFKSFVESK